MSAPPIDWPSVIPFAVGETVAFRVSWMLAALNGSAAVVENAGPRLKLAFVSPEQRILGKRIPRAVFAFGFESLVDGRGEAVLEIDGARHADPNALLQAEGLAVRAAMAGAAGEDLSFLIAPDGRRRVALKAIRGAKVPPGAKGALIGR